MTVGLPRQKLYKTINQPCGCMCGRRVWPDGGLSGERSMTEHSRVMSPLNDNVADGRAVVGRHNHARTTNALKVFSVFFHVF